MGLRFRKSITIIPNLLSLNISKSGVSFSFGPQGKSVSVGTSGVYGNVGLGRGLSCRKKLLNIQLPKTAKSWLKTATTFIVIAYLVYHYAWPLIGKLVSAGE